MRDGREKLLKIPKTIKSTSECDRGGYATAGSGSWLPETEARALTRGYDGLTPTFSRMVEEKRKLVLFFL
jgi:hypothetical protein